MHGMHSDSVHQSLALVYLERTLLQQKWHTVLAGPRLTPQRCPQLLMAHSVGWTGLGRRGNVLYLFHVLHEG